MARRRLGVVVLVPAAEAAAIDGLRRAVGTDIGRIPAHLTLVPPVNVAEADLPAALSVLRAAAAATRPLRLRLGPPASFEPVSPVLYLAVAGDLGGLSDLRDRVFVEPLARDLTHPFHPHVTLGEDLPTERSATAISSLRGFTVEITLDRVHLLEEQRLADGRRVWRPIADAPFTAAMVVGRGGLPLDLVVSDGCDPEGVALVGAAWPHRPFAVTARRDGAVVGVATGVVAGDWGRLDGLVVAEGHRRQGIGNHLLARFEAGTVERGARRLFFGAPVGSAVLALCRARGWEAPEAGSTAVPIAVLLRRLD